MSPDTSANHSDAAGPDPADVDPAAELIAYLDASPTPFHACHTAAALLTAAGYAEVVETQRFPATPGRYFVIRGGSLIAWNSTAGTEAFRIVGAHTDSPNLRIKPQPDSSRAGWQMLGVETYGGPLLNSWLDRDLGLAGRVAIRDGNRVRTELLHISEPMLRVSQLAIHLHREVNTDGLRLNEQAHLVPHWGLGEEPGDFPGWLADRVGARAADVLGWDMMTFDLTGARRIGKDGELLASGRLDNLATSYAAIVALLAADSTGTSDTESGTRMIALFDHEEVGSVSERGAASTLLPTIAERIVLAAGGDRDDYLRALAATVIASGDMAHATHPNYAERHEPQHQIAINGGPVLKVNNKLRYATDSVGAAAFSLACQQAGVPMQQFVTRSDLPCGSTVGPVTSSLMGARTVDFGAPMLSMHSAREVAGTHDQPMYAAALAAFLAPAN